MQPNSINKKASSQLYQISQTHRQEPQIKSKGVYLVGKTVNKLIQRKKKRQENKGQTVKINENEEVVVNRKEVSENSEEGYEDSRRMITKTARFSMNEEEAKRKKIKTCNEELLVVKLQKKKKI